MKHYFEKPLLQQCAMSLALCVGLLPGVADAAGTLTPVGSAQQPVQITDHHLSVRIEGGFAKTEVRQTFFNPNAQDLEAFYSFPVPKHGSLSEFSITTGETEIFGEVLAKDHAKQVYEEERQSGNQSGLAEKNSYQDFTFRVAKVAANNSTAIRIVYYQPIQLDTGVGRYVYPLESGGTDELANSFWTMNEKVESSFSADVSVRPGYPIADVRVPGFESIAQIDRPSESEAKIRFDAGSTTLSRDVVIYYRLAEDLPGRVELVTYRPDASKPGTFMAVLTPGIDLPPVTGGSDYVYVLDVSGSMQGKLQLLAKGVQRAIREHRADDRFRIVLFSDSAQELTSGWVNISPESIAEYSAKLDTVQVQGGTDIYSGLELGMKKLDADRISSIVLVTDGVTNTGIVDPVEFKKLFEQKDIRVFGFLLGNSSNWPLLQLIAETSGGFYAPVSNNDDIAGQLILAKSKITSEALHHVALKVKGVSVTDTSKTDYRKIYRGQQIVLFGRYDRGGKADLTLNAALSGQDKVYRTTVEFPETDTAHPELERLWAFDQIESIESNMRLGLLEATEGKKALEDLGVAYQLVTDETSMVVASDESFARRGIDRRNQVRVGIENQAQAQRWSAPPVSYRVDNSAPMFPDRSHSIPRSGRGGGAFGPLAAGGALMLVMVGMRTRRTM